MSLIERQTSICKLWTKLITNAQIISSPKQLKNWLTLVEIKMEGLKLRCGDSRIFTIDKSSSKFGDIFEFS